jgi:hypothetical protein
MPCFCMWILERGPSFCLSVIPLVFVAVLCLTTSSPGVFLCSLHDSETSCISKSWVPFCMHNEWGSMGSNSYSFQFPFHFFAFAHESSPMNFGSNALRANCLPCL